MPVPQKIRRLNKPVAYRELDGMKIWAYNDRGLPICNAQRMKQGGLRCQSIHVVPPSGRCKKHGGHTRYGLTHQSTKVGKYSKYLPASFRQKYEESLQDPDYLSLRDSIAVIDARLKALYAKIDETLDEISLSRVRQLARNIQRAFDNPDALKEYFLLRRYGQEIIEIADHGKDAKAEWADIQKNTSAS